MQLKHILAPLALACNVIAQGSTPSLQDLLRSENQTLGSLGTLLGSLPSDVTRRLNDARNVTILAPSNQALSAFLGNTATARRIRDDPGLVAAVIQYHVLNGTYYASNLTQNSDKATFIPTHLTNETYTNVTGGQRVEALSSNGNVTFLSALKESANVTQTNLNFTGGTVHVIDGVLSIPLNVTDTLLAANLTAAYGAIERADLGSNLTDTRDITVFAPTNEAFLAISSLLGNASTSELRGLLAYHVVQGRVLYSDLIRNSSVRALDGTELNVRQEDGNTFVNSAEVVTKDLLIENGVVHVINGVLNPRNSTATPNPTASTQAPAFSGASTASNGIPFTTNVTAPTSTAPVGTNFPGGGGGGSGGTSTSEQLAPPMRTAAAGAAALLGGAVLMFNGF